MKIERVFQSDLSMASSLIGAQEALKNCEEHVHEEVTCFCKTCKKFICTTCAKTTHHEHDWDIISSVAKVCRKTIPIFCQTIMLENVPKCHEMMRVVDDNVSTLEKAGSEDVKKLEDRRIAVRNITDQIIEKQRRNREEYTRKECEIMREKGDGLRTKKEYLDKMTESLSTKIGDYSDYDVIEMEMNMMVTLREIESCDVGLVASAVKFIPGEINQEMIEKMIGAIDVNDEVRIEVVKTFKEFDGLIHVIAPTSPFDALAYGSNKKTVKTLCLNDSEAKTFTLNNFASFIALSNGDIIATYPDDQVIRQISLHNEVRDISSTKPLFPTCVSATLSGDILVTLWDRGHHFDLDSSNRRLVQRMTLKGKIINTYEFQENGTKRLFTFPSRTAENCNTDICVINATSKDKGEVILLRENGQVRFIYRGQTKKPFDPFDIACDSRKRVIVADFTSKSLHLLNSEGIFIQRILSDLTTEPCVVALHQNNLWVGFKDGLVKVYKYIIPIDSQ